jgi:1-acyl-sn-glycerol-3-phosphate acyltransferase
MFDRYAVLRIEQAIEFRRVQRSRTLQTLRFGFSILVVALSATILYSCAFICAPFDRRRDFINRAFGGAWARTCQWTFGTTVKIEGEENLAGGGPFIFVSNHISYLDVMAIIGRFPVVVRFLAKKTLVWIPVFGISLYTLDHVFIDRHKKVTHKESMDAIAKKTKEGKSIWIFPGGKRAPDGRLGEWKKGAFVIATQLHVPIAPVAITGSAALHGIGDVTVRPGTITMRIGRPISTVGTTYEDRDELLRQTREAVEELIDHVPHQ